MHRAYESERLVDVRREVFDPEEIPADLRRYFEEVQVQCGAPWARVIDTRYEPHGENARSQVKTTYGERTGGDQDKGKFRPQEMEFGRATRVDVTTAWRPTCRCPGVAEQAPVPCRVLDPFSGSGTTLLAANRLGRDATGVELKPAYNDLARKRVGREPLSLFAWRNEDTPEEVEV